MRCSQRLKTFPGVSSALAGRGMEGLLFVANVWLILGGKLTGYLRPVMFACLAGGFESADGGEVFVGCADGLDARVGEAFGGEKVLKFGRDVFDSAAAANEDDVLQEVS